MAKFPSPENAALSAELEPIAETDKPGPSPFSFDDVEDSRQRGGASGDNGGGNGGGTGGIGGEAEGTNSSATTETHFPDMISDQFNYMD